ncbi:MAG: hypothetical protein ACK5LY_02060 [Lachnospirales bacterium]
MDKKNNDYKSKAKKRANFQRAVALCLAVMMILSAFAVVLSIFI